MGSQISRQEEPLSLSLWEVHLLLRLRQLQDKGVRYIRLDLLEKAIIEKTDANQIERLDNGSKNL